MTDFCSRIYCSLLQFAPPIPLQLARNGCSQALLLRKTIVAGVLETLLKKDPLLAGQTKLVAASCRFRSSLLFGPTSNRQCSQNARAILSLPGGVARQFAVNPAFTLTGTNDNS